MMRKSLLEGQGYLVIPEFQEWFRDNIFMASSTLIAWHLNEIRWGIYRYLHAEFQRAYIHTPTELDPQMYKYDVPADITNSLVQSMYWDLMNGVRTPPYFPRFTVAQSLLKELPLWNGGDFVFSSTNGRTPVSGFSKTKTRLDKLCGVSDWTLHDIRRSVATHMAAAGVTQEHIERVLGHKIQGVAGTYNRHSYLDQKLKAFEVWEHCLASASINLKVPL